MVPSVNDIVIIPMDFSIVAKVNLKDNQPTSEFQTYETKLIKPLMKFRPCQFVFNPDLNSVEDDEEEDDFADSDSIEDLLSKVVGRQKKITDM